MRRTFRERHGPGRGHAVAAVLALAAFAGPTASAALTDPIPPGPFIRLQEVVQIPASSGSPTVMATAGDGSGRRFVGGQAGVVHRLMGDGSVAGTPFLDLAAAGIPLEVGGEKGLLGLAFHPDFALANPAGTPGRGKLYTYTSETPAAAPDFIHPELAGTGLGDHHSVVREWTVSPGAPHQVDLSVPSRVVLRIHQPQANHNGGALVFGPDGMLYVALGDGGGRNDFGGAHDNPLDGHTNVIGNAQDTSNVYGSILRIDPVAGGGAPYGVPADNPLVGVPGLDEIFAYGLRNPFRMSFDRVTGALWAGDVGQNAREEVDWIVPGENYGWPFVEGTRTNRHPPDPVFVQNPVAEYTHDEGSSVIGGFVYRGSAAPYLQGLYVFADLTGGPLVMDPATGDIERLQRSPAGAPFPGTVYSLGEDGGGELYFLGGDGAVLRLVSEPAFGPALVLLCMAVWTLRTRRAEARSAGTAER